MAPIGADSDDIEERRRCLCGRLLAVNTNTECKIIVTPASGWAVGPIEKPILCTSPMGQLVQYSVKLLQELLHDADS